MQQSRIYIDGIVVDQQVSLGNLKSSKRKNQTAVWVDLVNPSPAELEALGKELGLHPLAVEDAIAGRQRAKLEHYDSHLFINVYSASWDSELDKLTTHEISVFVTPNALITVRDDDGWDIDQLTRRWDESSSLAHLGVAFLLWGLLDLIVDGYFEVVEKLDVEVDELEDLLFVEGNAHNDEIQKRTYRLRKALVTLRRVAIPMREIVNPLVRRDTQVIGGEMMAYFQDIYDHVMRVADWTDSLRDLVTTLLETNLTIQGNRMNMVMKKVTSWAAIIAVPTAITGWFGQNVPYLGFSSVSGVWMSAGSIVVVSLALYWAFKRNDWL